MAIVLAILVFLTIAVVVFAFGAASVAPSSVLGSRLREIGWQPTESAAQAAHARALPAGSRSAEPRPASLSRPTSPKPAPG